MGILSFDYWAVSLFWEIMWRFLSWFAYPSIQVFKVFSMELCHWAPQGCDPWKTLRLFAMPRDKPGDKIPPVNAWWLLNRLYIYLYIRIHKFYAYIIYHLTYLHIHTFVFDRKLGKMNPFWRIILTTSKPSWVLERISPTKIPPQIINLMWLFVGIFRKLHRKSTTQAGTTKKIPKNPRTIWMSFLWNTSFAMNSSAMTFPICFAPIISASTKCGQLRLRPKDRAVACKVGGFVLLLLVCLKRFWSGNVWCFEVDVKRFGEICLLRIKGFGPKNAVFFKGRFR